MDFASLAVGIHTACPSCPVCSLVVGPFQGPKHLGVLLLRRNGCWNAALIARRAGCVLKVEGGCVSGAGRMGQRVRKCEGCCAISDLKPNMPSVLNGGTLGRVFVLVSRLLHYWMFSSQFL